LLADAVPDDPRHLVAVHLDDRALDLDLAHGCSYRVGGGSRGGARLMQRRGTAAILAERSRPALDTGPENFTQSFAYKGLSCL
ncbi:MAG TPA: hypothetical protein VLV56_07650, partial [Burkholderiales bacterium]|nr:hypothetical protein [Burkholderiales bacterium]